MKEKLPLNPKAIANYLSRRITPGRILLDQFMERHIPTLTGEVLEVGSVGGGRSKIAHKASNYVLSNLYPQGKVIKIDMLDMDLPDDSFDAIVSEVMLEHVPNHRQALRETARVLKRGGIFVLVVPWMYPFHAAPDDYYRFSKTALNELLDDDFEIRTLEYIGNLWSTISLFLQLKVWPWGSRHSKSSRLARLCFGSPLLILGVAFYLLANIRNGEDDFSMLYGVVAVRK